VLGKRAGGSPRLRRMTRFALVAIAAASMTRLAIATSHASIPWTMVLAVVPGLVAAVSLATWPSPPPLKSVGWSLALTSTAAALILIGEAGHLLF
jgi:hypothetical protein